MPEEKKKSTQSQSEESGPRPFPIPPRDPKKVRVFALVVGINDYKDGIPPLYGCLNDVEQVTGYLRKKFGTSTQQPEIRTLAAVTKPENGAKTIVDPAITVETTGRLHLCTLLDSQATHGNIVRAFREHLGRATEQDTVWFHFSGHGSEQFTAPEFEAIDPNGKDQTLVCYKDQETGTGSQLFLADKELAVLLHELSGKNPHIVVSLDSCHSGSGTREMMEPAGIKPRVFRFLQSARREDPALLPDESAVRGFDSYLDGYYSNVGKPEIPPAEHVLLSACESVQTAGDMAQGGVFTTSLIQTLNEATGPIHYARLFTKARARANQKRSAQNPQFETIDGFDPYTDFLTGEPMEDISEHYEVFRQGDNWYVRCGAIHGLPVGARQPIKLMIRSDNPKADNGNPVKIGAQIVKVGAQHSKIKPFHAGALDKDGEYFAEILAMPAAPRYVALHGVQSAVDALKTQWDASKNILLATEMEPPDLSVEATADDGFVISDAHTGRKFIEVPKEAGELDRRLALVKQNLDKIVRWKRMIDLDNPNSRIKNRFDYELLLRDKKQTTPYKAKKVKELKIDSDDLFEDKGDNLISFQFKVTVKDDSQPLYLYGFHMGHNCAISFYNDEEKDTRGMNAGDAKLLRSKALWWRMEAAEDSVTRWFKLFVTTEELDYHQLTQSGLIGTKEGIEEDFNPDKISEDWCAETIKVTLMR